MTRQGQTTSPRYGLAMRLLQLARHSVGRLRRLARLDKATFIANEDNFAIAESCLHRALAAPFDGGTRLLLDLRLGHALKAQDVPRILAEQGIIPPRLSAKALALLKLRSRCQNIRRPITPAEMHTVLRTRLDDIAAFADSLLRLAEQGAPRRR